VNTKFLDMNVKHVVAIHFVNTTIWNIDA
jgi:hypothetical protein